MIIEGRTITNVAEMLEFCLAAIAQAGVEPAAKKFSIGPLRHSTVVRGLG